MNSKKLMLSAVVRNRYKEIPGVPWSFPCFLSKICSSGQNLQNLPFRMKNSLINSPPQGILVIGIRHKIGAEIWLFDSPEANFRGPTRPVPL